MWALRCVYAARENFSEEEWNDKSRTLIFVASFSNLPLPKASHILLSVRGASQLKPCLLNYFFVHMYLWSKSITFGIIFEVRLMSICTHFHNKIVVTYMSFHQVGFKYYWCFGVHIFKVSIPNLTWGNELFYVFHFHWCWPFKKRCSVNLFFHHVTSVEH